MRIALLISAMSHIALVAFALLGTPKLFDNVPIETIEVDLVREQQAESEPEPLKEKELEKKPPEKTAEWNPFPPSASAAPASSPDANPSQTKQKQPQQARAEQPSQKDLTPQKAPTPQASPADRQAPQTPAPERPTQQALATPAPSAPAEVPSQQSPWIFDPMNIPALMSIPNGGPQSEFDSEATTTANLSTDDRAAFKQHLKRCLKLPGGMSDSTRVTLRIFLKRDGGLAGEPVLIEGSASSDGPRLMQAAVRSVKECQPFAFLPADRYREWKALDVSFSPKEWAGG